MENISNNKVLCLNNEENIERKREAILNLLSKGVDVFTFFDTETTGLNMYPTPEAGIKRDRLLEVGFVVYYMDSNQELKPLMLDGNPISFQEYINPFAESQKELLFADSVLEINPEAQNVHKLSKEFLAGKTSFNGIKLHKSAPTFKELKPFMERFLCLDKLSEMSGKMHFVGHNAQKFDAPFLTEEMYIADRLDGNNDLKSTFESKVESLIDTYKIIQDVYTREDLNKFSTGSEVRVGYSMSYFAHMMGVKEEGREDFHGALLDSQILQTIFSEFIKRPEWLNAKNKINFNYFGKKEDTTQNYSIPAFDFEGEKLNNFDGKDILTIVKTDASKEEGTGTIKEYVEAAKEAGLKNLVLADVVTVSRFVEFYEGCKKEGIKPIIGATFKVESSYDVDNFLQKNKENGSLFEIEEVVKSILSSYDINIENLKEYFKKKDINVLDINSIYLGVSNVSSIINKGKSTFDRISADIEKIVKGMSSLFDFEYKKGDIDTKSLISLISSKREIVKFKEFSRMEDHSDITLLANNDDGFLTIKKLITEANMNGQHFVQKGKMLGRGENPLITMEMLANLNKDVTALMGNKKDLLGRAVKAKDVRRSQFIVRDLKEIFGDNLYYQISSEFNHFLNNKESRDEYEFLKNVKRVSEVQGVEGLAVHNVAFAKREDYKTHINKYAILQEKSISDITLDTGVESSAYIHSFSDLMERFSNNPKLIENATNFLQKAQLNPVLHTPTLPAFKTGNGNTQDQELVERSINGLKKRLQPAFKKALAKGLVENSRESYVEFCNHYKERLDYELGIIKQMDFSGYFLIKQQMIDFCKEKGIPVGAGRGSAAGSLVVYSLGITDADPIEHGLIFERFLNPERKEMPDIDTDIDGEYRDSVLNFLIDEYKEDGLGYVGASYIMTKGTFSAKNTIRAMAKAKGLSLHWADTLAKQISEVPNTKLINEIEENEIIAERYRSEPMTKLIIDEAIELEKNGGRQISLGKHAGGIVVGDLINKAPITYIRGVPVIQADKGDVESLGAVKFDLLGLNTLSKVDLALRKIEESLGLEELEKIGIIKDGKIFNFDNLHYDDKETFEMLKNGDSTGVFQIESDMFKELLKNLKPDSLSDIVALVSLGRPGPMQSGMDEMFIRNKFNPEERELYHPLIDNLLDETNGTIVYQEQVMAIAQKLSGFTMGQADFLRKAMGKKKVEEMEKQKGLFIEGAKNNGVDEKLAENIFNTIEKFAGYGFNKSHALAYSMLTYKTAFLKRHYPAQMLASILTLDAQGNSASKDLPKGILSCVQSGVKLYTPNINKSKEDFLVGKDSKSILFGLSGIKGSSFDKVLEEREKNGEFKNMEDFILRCKPSKSIESLINSGAMDCLKLAIDLEPEDKVLISGMDAQELRIMKRSLLEKEYLYFKEILSSDVKRKKYVVGSFDKDKLSSSYKEVAYDYSNNKKKCIMDALEKENELIGGYVTTHPILIGKEEDKILTMTKNPKIPLASIDSATKGVVKKSFSVVGCVKEVSANRTSKAGNKYSIVELSDPTSSKAIFMDNNLFNEVNKAIAQKNRRGLLKGDAIGVDISFYEKNGKINVSVDSIYSSEYNVRVDRKNKNGLNNRYK